MMLSILDSTKKKRNKICSLCNDKFEKSSSYPDVCKHKFHYKCLRNYVDIRLEKKESIVCPEQGCKKYFGRIANKYKKSEDIIYQNVILSSDENQCCICFLKYQTPVASSDSCSHSFCFECLKKWCTFKHECPMDRMPIKMLLISDFPGSHITSQLEPPAVEQDLNGDGDNDELINTTCEVCNSGQDEHQLLLCDNCNRGYHIYCLPVPLSNIPEGDWFCEQCEGHEQNESPVRNGGLLRGLGRIIESIEDRYTGNVFQDSPIQTRTTRNSRGARATRTTVRAARAARYARRNDPISDSEGDWVSESDILPTLRTRNRTERPRNSGIRTRGAAARAGVTNSDEDDVVIGSSIRRRTQMSSGSDDEIESPVELRTSNVADVTIPSAVESPRNEEPATSEIMNTRARASRTSNMRNAMRKRRQGSLSSDIESEVEPRRKKQRLNSGSTSNESVDAGEIESSTTEDEILQITSPITTRLRARPRSVEVAVQLADDSEDEQMTDEQNFSPASPAAKKRLVIESDSGEEETEEDRQRHISTSSSLSTIPCRVTEMRQMATELKVKAPAKESHIEPQDVFSNSSSNEDTESEYNPETYNSDAWQPSTSKRKTSKRTRTCAKRRSSRQRRPKRLSNNDFDYDEDRGNSMGSSQDDLKPSENRVPMPGGGHKRAATRSMNSGGSILSEINDSHRNVPPVQTQKDKIVLTIKHGTSMTNNSSVPVVDDALPVPPQRRSHAPYQHPSVPSTSSAGHRTSQSSKEISTASITTPSFVSSGPCIDSKAPDSRLSASTCSAASSTSSGPSSGTRSTKVTEPEPGPIWREEMHKVIVRYVTKALQHYFNKDMINRDEFKSLNERIATKVYNKKSDRTNKSRVVDYVTKYMNYYLSKRVSGPASDVSGGSGTTVG